MEQAFIVPLATAFLALLIGLFLYKYVASKSSGNKKMKEIQQYIREGAKTFMLEEAKVFWIVAIVIAAILFILFYWEVSFAFLLGAAFSMAAGLAGMNSTTLANAKVANAARKSEKNAFNIAISGGAVMGLAVAGLALLGLSIVLIVFAHYLAPEALVIESKELPLIGSILGTKLQINFIKMALIISAYSMGASLVALFYRVGGGIYTKAADMAADLVGKTELKIPEDDPRNPAVIADNVGDNVGDVGGLGSDLLESFVGALVSAIVILLYVYVGSNNADIANMLAKVGLSVEAFKNSFLAILSTPLLIVGMGIIATIAALAYLIFWRSGRDLQKMLMNGMLIGALLTLVFAYLIMNSTPFNMNLFYCLILGAVAGLIIGYTSEYYTSAKYAPVKKLAEETAAGAGIGIAKGLGLGMASTFIPAIVIAASVIVSYMLAGLLGVAFGAIGMLSFVAITVSVDAYGPIADNAGGIAEGAELPEKVRKTTDKLDAIGNTTAAIGKGFAIGSAAFSALALIVAYMWSAIGSAGEVNLPVIEILSRDPRIGGAVIAALFIGAAVPYFFSSLLISAVSETARKLVEEIKRQFKEKPGILKGTEKADYNRCIAITSKSGLRKMVPPALLALAMPFIIGFLLGKYALAGFLVGSLLSSLQLAMFCANAGGALDNSKKYIEEGHFGGKGSEAHVGAVIGDTIGDPLKDTVGPSLNILVKLMSIISVLFASLFPVYPIIF